MWDTGSGASGEDERREFASEESDSYFTDFGIYKNSSKKQNCPKYQLPRRFGRKLVEYRNDWLVGKGLCGYGVTIFPKNDQGVAPLRPHTL